MLTVYKYRISAEDYFSVTLPQGAKILTVQVQHHEAFLWALVDPGNKAEVRRFRLAGTGHPIEESAADLHYINTFQFGGGALVFHLFELSPLLLENLIDKNAHSGL